MKQKKFLAAFCMICLFVSASIYLIFLCGCKSTSPVNLESYISAAAASHRAETAKGFEENTVTLEMDEAEQLGMTNYVSDGYQIEYSRHSTSQSYDGMLALGSMDTSWYPGAILKLSYRENEDNKFVSTNLKRKPITISASLETVSGIAAENLSATIEHPENLSESRIAVSRIINSIYNSNTAPDLPMRMSCSVVEVTKEEDMNIAVGLNTGFCGFGLNTSFSVNNSSKRTRAVLVMKQIYFTIDPDKPNTLSEAFDGVSDEQILKEFSDGTLPVYCSVVYGRIALVTIETDMTIDELKASVNAHYSSFVELNTSLETLYRQKNTSMNFFLYGGTSEMEGALCVSTINEFIEYLNKTDDGAPLPIGYRFYYTDNGTLAKIATYTEFYTQKMVPIKVEDFSFSMRKTGSTNLKTSSVVAGDVLCCDLEVVPSKARAFEVTYSINKCKDNEGNFFAVIDSETGRLRIFDNAVVGETIKVTATLTQNINGQVIVVQRDKIFRVESIPVENIYIEPVNMSTDIIKGGSILLNATVAPVNASFKDNLDWKVISGPAIFENSNKGLLKLRFDAQTGDKVQVCATSNNLVESNVITFTVVARQNEILSGLILSAENNAKYLTAGSELNLSLTPVPYDFDLDTQQLSYELIDGYEFAHIKNNVLYINRNINGIGKVVVQANYGEIKSNSIIIEILKNPTLINNNSGFYLNFPYDARISLINIVVLDKDKICLEKMNIESGDSVNLLKYSAKDNGSLSIIAEYNTNDKNSCSLELTTHSLYEGGEGTKENPYKINSVRHFNNINHNNSAFFKITDDIDIGSKDAWSGITEFNGYLDGGNKKLKFKNNLNVDMSVNQNKEYGIITENNFGTICNLIIDNASYNSYTNYHKGSYLISMGGIAGINKSGAVIRNVILQNCAFNCDRNNSAFGSICGINEGLVENCEVSNTNIYSTGDCGGIVGRLNSGTISGCSFDGQIGLYIANDNGGQNLRSWGGIVGYVYGSNPVIENCSVEACKFYYHGENAIYHRKYLFGAIHITCNMQIKVGMIAGHIENINSTNFINCNIQYDRCPLKLNLISGNFHYGDHEKKNLFAHLNGKVGLM